jgi:TRAP-type C4-dicarboxylate transport system substrate-binding protein
MKYRSLLMVGAFALAVAGGAAHAKEVNIKLSYWVPPSHPLTPGYKDWAAAVEKASGGTIKTTLYPSSQLGSGKDHYDMVKRGIAGRGLINPGYTPGRFPVIGASDLPFTIRDSLGGARALTRWYKSKYAQKEMGDSYVCSVYTHDIATIHTTKKPVHVPDDVKGLKIRSANQTMSRFVTAIGGTPVQVPIMEAKDTLEKGITDGITVTTDGIAKTSVFKFGDVVKYTLNTPLYVSTFVENINKRLYDGMDASQRKVIDDHCTPEWSAKVYHYWYNDAKADLKDAWSNLPGHTWYQPTEDEMKLWFAAAEPVVQQWKDSVKKAGYDPDVVLKEMKDELKKEKALF